MLCTGSISEMRISTLEKKMEHMAAAVNGIILLDWLSAASFPL
jgi:hypothetical protein